MLFHSPCTIFVKDCKIWLIEGIDGMLKYQIPTWMQMCYRGVTWRKKTDRKVIYLTFDDGCVPEVTPQVLTILKDKGVKATFFCVGDNVRKHPELFERIKAEGHQVGNHTHNHLKGIKTPLKVYLENVAEANRLIESTLFRPPYGKMSFKQKHILQKEYEIVMWDVLTNDFDIQTSVTELLQQTKRHTRNGSVIVFHDSIKAAERMLHTLPTLIDWWKEQGYAFETL